MCVCVYVCVCVRVHACTHVRVWVRLCLFVRFLLDGTVFTHKDEKRKPAVVLDISLFRKVEAFPPLYRHYMPVVGSHTEHTIVYSCLRLAFQSK